MNIKQNKSVFISHSSKDFSIATEICAILETMGVTCWIAPRDIQPGENYGSAILRGLEGCSAVLFLLTEHSNSSGPVQSEIERAFNYNKVIIPVRLKNIAPSKELEFFVSRAQWVDAIYEPLKKRMDLVRDVVHAIETHHTLPAAKAEKRTLAGSVERFIETRLRHKFTSAIGAFLILAGMGGTTLYLQQHSTSVVSKASESISNSSTEINQAATDIKKFGGQIDEVKKETSTDPRKELGNMGLVWSMDYYLDTLNDPNVRSLFEQGGMKASKNQLISYLIAQSYTPEAINHLKKIHTSVFGECPTARRNVNEAYIKLMFSSNSLAGLELMKLICPEFLQGGADDMLLDIDQEIEYIKSGKSSSDSKMVARHIAGLNSLKNLAHAYSNLGYAKPLEAINNYQKSNP